MKNYEKNNMRKCRKLIQFQLANNDYLFILSLKRICWKRVFFDRIFYEKLKHVCQIKYILNKIHMYANEENAKTMNIFLHKFFEKLFKIFRKIH